MDEASLLAFRAQARSFIYDKAIVSLTSQWYLNVLEYLPDNSHVLDIGIGTGAALIANANTLRAKNISIVGVDNDADYVATCGQNIAAADLQQLVTVVHADIYEYRPRDNRLFDHVYFSGSFMLLPQPAQVLKKVVDLLVDREDGRVLFTQTFELQKNVWMEWLKPTLSTVTGIQFGNVTYEGDFEDALYEGGVAIENVQVLEDGNRTEGVRESRFVIARSRLYVPTETESAT